MRSSAKQGKRLPPAPAVALESWIPLYQKARDICALKPWRQISNRQIFAYVDPKTQRTCYCSIMGGAGFFGVCAYRSREAFEIPIEGELEMKDPSTTDVTSVYDALLLDLNPGPVDPEDKKVREALPSPLCLQDIPISFRSFLPKFRGWYLTEEEVHLFTTILDCALHYSLAVLSERKKMPVGYSECLLYTKNEQGVWETRVEEIPPYVPQTYPPVALNTKRIDKLKEYKLHRDSTWEVSICSTEQCILDRDRPYFAYVSLIVHQESYMLLQVKPISIDESSRELICENILAAIEQHKRLPAEILFNQQELYEAVKPLGKILGIEISFDSNLPATRPAVDSLLEHMNNSST